ncbi:MAG: DoxX family protein [Thioclava marina]|jgi:Predicted membrane protein|uniref:DoxX family protein n=1 Tax=Thioclava marina TaxID=1915077 RepID=UPI0019B71A3E|nr:DoxX family protein [Thioclava marina]MBC7144131.1 DoxX family protein [Thioclava marina]
MEHFLQRLDPFLSLLARILMATLFVMAGMDVAMDFAKFSARLEADGLSGYLTGPVFWFLIGTGLLLLVGAWTRLVALAMAGFTLASGIIDYGDFAHATDMVMLLKNIALTGGYLYVALHGPGRWSVDALFGRAG